METYDFVQDLISAVRSHAGLTQEALAERRGVSRTAQQAIETPNERSIGWHNVTGSLNACYAHVSLFARMPDGTIYGLAAPGRAHRGASLISERLTKARSEGTIESELAHLGIELTAALGAVAKGQMTHEHTREWEAWLSFAMLIVDRESERGERSQLERMIQSRGWISAGFPDGDPRRSPEVAEADALLDYVSEMFTSHHLSLRFSPALEAAPENLRAVLNEVSGAALAQQFVEQGYLVAVESGQESAED